jgi:hypothetical protein
MQYRRRRKRDVWHYRPDCSNWPADDARTVIHSHGKPRSGEFCNECRAKAKRKTK